MKRIVTAFCLMLALHASPPAGAQVMGPPVQTHGQALPLPPPGTFRLIRIGPQALVIEDDQGRVAMVDEPTKPPRPGRHFIATSALFWILGVGAYLMLQGEPGVTLDLRGSDVIW